MSWHEYNIYSKTYTEGFDPFVEAVCIVEIPFDGGELRIEVDNYTEFFWGQTPRKP